MIKSKTVFVVGAGASAEIGLPVGSELVRRIATCLAIGKDGYFAEIEIDKALARVPPTAPHPLGYNDKEIARRLCEAMPLAPSIDNYLHTHRSDQRLVLLGKLCIASTILAAERKSPLWIDPAFPDRAPPFQEVAGTWYTRLWHVLSTGIELANVETIFSNVSFVVFNYDRCIEQFLSAALRSYYRLDPVETTEIMGTLKIFHPYGQVGSLTASATKRPVSFGGAATGDLFIELAQQIKTFTEGVADEAVMDDMYDVFVNAKKLVFLGFGYHELNMELLTSERQTEIRKVFGTRMGMSDNDADVIKQRILQILMEKADDDQNRRAYDRNMLVREIVNPQLVNGTCSDLFKEYSQSIVV